MRPKINTVEILFERCVPEPNSGCWLWTGANTGKSGYAQVMEMGRQWVASRLMAEIILGHRIPDGVQVLHTCDTRSCLNPDHLFLGTHQDNMRDMVWKGRKQREC